MTDKLLDLAKGENKTVLQYLNDLEKEKSRQHLNDLIDACGGNEETARYILSLEQKEEKGYFGEREFKEFFPDGNIDELPLSVRENSRKNNTSILDEYLRYRARSVMQNKKEEDRRKQEQVFSVGSMRSTNLNDMSPERYEFLKGLWG